MSTCTSLWLTGGLLGRLLGFFFKRVGGLQGLQWVDSDLGRSLLREYPKATDLC